jgi:hypothetical protein
MQTRREFLTGATVMLVLVPIGCSGGGNDTSTSTQSNEPSCDGAGATSTLAGNHTHFVCVPAVDLSNPPPTGNSYTSTESQNHKHNISLTQAQLQSIASGQTVTVTSGGPNPVHDFTLRKA